MLSPECLVVDIRAQGGVRKLGEFLCKLAYVGEPLGTTLDVDCAFRQIHGATPFVQDGDFDIVELTVKGRERAPIIGLGTTRIATARRSDPRPRWVPLHELRGRESILVPVLEGSQWAICEAPIRKIRKGRNTIPKFIPDSKPLLMSMWLDAGKGKSFWCPGGVIHV